MDISDGNLSFTATMDTSDLDSSRDVLVKYFTEMGMSAEEAGKQADKAMQQVQSAVSEAMQSVETDAEAMEVLKAALEEIQEQMEGMEDGSAKEFLGGVAEGIASVVDQMEQMEQVDNPVEDLAKGSTSARSQMREMREELIQLRLAGKENTEEYQRLLEKMGVLQDAMSDTAQATSRMASDTAALDAVLGAAQLTAGGFSTVMGAMNLFGVGEDTKELAEAQKKLQAVMAITTGLMSVQNALQKQSTIMLGIERIRTLAAAKAKAVMNIETGKYVIATNSATIAQKAFNIVANANPYVLLATALTTVVGALWAFSKGSKAAAEQEEELNEKTEELKRKHEELNKAIADYAAKSINSYKRLQREWKDLTSEHEKNKWIKDNANMFKELGFQINGVADAENLLVNQSDAVLKAFMLRAKASAYASLAAEKYKEAIEQQLKSEEAQKRLDKEREKVSDWQIEDAVRFGRLREGDYERDEKGRLRLTERGYERYMREQGSGSYYVKKGSEKNAKRYEEEAEDLIVREQSLMEEYNALLEEAGIKTVNTVKDTDSKLINEHKRYLEELKKAKERAEDLELEAQPDNLNTRIAKVELDYERQISDVRKKADEERLKGNIELAEQYERQLSALMVKRDAEINKLLDNEAKEQEAYYKEQAAEQEKLLDKYADYEARKKAITKKYEDDIKKLEKLRDDTTDKDERIRYESAIAEAQHRQTEELTELEIEYGYLNQLAAKRDDIEQQLLVIANKIKQANNEEDKEALAKEAARLRGELTDVNKEIDEMNKMLGETQDHLGEISATDIVGIARDLTDAFTEMSGASKDTADNIGIIADGISSVAKGYAQGGIAGAIIGALDWAIEGMKSLAEQTAEENAALEELQLQLDKIHQSLNINDSNYDTMFGDDAVGRVQALTAEYKRLNREVKELINYYTEGAAQGMMDFATYRLAGLNNQNLEEMAREFGMSLYDQSGNGYNTQFLEMLLDQYGESLTEDERRLLQSLLNVSESYQSAMEQIASYLESLFGNVADTIADQMIDSFIESGQAAMDFGSIVGDVSRQMAKDFIKSTLIDKVFMDMTDDFESIMSDNTMSTDEKQRQLIAMLAAAQSKVDEIRPEIQAYLETMSQFFGASDDMNEAVMSGNLLQSASQDSVDLLNGQLNAIRVNQSMTTNRIDDVLLQLSGIRNDMNNGLGQSVRHLESIDRNTSSGGSILTQLGIWIG